MSQRLDVELVHRGLARSRGHARELVTGGEVSVDGQAVTKPSTGVGDASIIDVHRASAQWVGRGAAKLLAALTAFGPAGLSVTGRRCIDVGASTGGFTQVLLKHGATQVVALDVGHGQLVAELRRDPRVVDASGTTVRGLDPATVGGPFEVLVADLSFISLQLVMPDLVRLLTPDADVVLLVKPQFEVGRNRLGKGGVVRSQQDRAAALDAVAQAAQRNGLQMLGSERCPIDGVMGNQEFLLWCRPAL
ncbi:MAG: TlyA family RNA methyltransferase [Nostocoides sp.]